MIFTMGTEIIETQRMHEPAARAIDPAQSPFTEQEASYYESKRRKSEHYAARFAAMRAALKALGAGGGEGIRLREVELTADERGKPEMLVHGRVKEFSQQQPIRRAALTRHTARTWPLPWSSGKAD